MCGIAGFYGSFDRNHLAAMTTALAHRGPDGEGLEVLPGLRAGDTVGLGHRRLSIIDLAGGHQPMWTADSQIGIVFNGEIYNFQALRRSLEAEGYVFRTNSDTEVILLGWRAWGQDVVNRLEGMFAFALWDKDQHLWFLARDRFGIKPLYYCRPPGGGIAFASEIKPLLPFRSNTAVNRSALYDYLLHGWSAMEETIFDGVFQLRPGHVMAWHVEAGGTPRQYWRLTPALVPRDEEECAHTIAEAFEAAVSSHLIADVPVGVMLSGGLDSSAVLSVMARRMPPEQIEAFSLGYGLPDDELPFARQAAAHFGVRLHERMVSPTVFAESFGRCLWHLEEPIAHPVMQTTFQISRFVREGVKVALIGEGSDELFAGYPQFRLFRPPFSLAPRNILRNTFIAVGCLMPTGRTLNRLLAPAWRDRDAVRTVERRFDPYFAQGNLPDGALQFEIETELVYNQLARVDKLTMAHSVEARVPFLDHRFAELAHGVPFGQKLRQGVHKHLLRRVMRDQLPPDIVYRPKTGRGGTQALLPMIQRMVTSGPLSHLISREAIGSRGFFDPDMVHRYLAEQNAWAVRRNPIESRRRAKFALALAVIEQWARIFLDGQSPDDFRL